MLLVLCSALLGCGASDARELHDVGFRGYPAFNAAYCSIVVDGVGEISMEDDYLPHVVTCENGGAGLEALKAQAIAARSVAYYAMASQGSICDGQACQVYTCSHAPTPEAIQAVEATRGQYLSYGGFLTYGFYVAGDPQTAEPSCAGDPAVGTEQWVTNNEGAQGSAVEQTPLGFIHDVDDYGYGQNRGCMSQWGARCLEDAAGYDHIDILRAYYGDDIEIVQAQGPCVSSTCNSCSYQDLPASHPAHAAAEALRDVGALYGCAAGTFCPDQALTRAELAWAIAHLNDIDGSTGSSFGDVSSSHWANGSIEGVAAQGIMSGCGGGNFCPQGSISRAAAPTFVGRAASLPPEYPSTATFSDTATTHWAYGRVEAAFAISAVSACASDPMRYCPSQAITRAEAAVLLAKAYDL